MSARELDSDLGGRFAELVENSAHVIFSRTRRHHDGSQEPLRSATRDRDVVGIDVYGVPADTVRGERDRIGFSQKRVFAEENVSRVFAESRPHYQPVVPWRDRQSLNQVLQKRPW